jgi:hypothetical protein
MKSPKSLLLLLVAVLILSPRMPLAQAGNDNPTGVAGMFNGNVTTAGSYDPYTGNTTRGPITDLAVAGGLETLLTPHPRSAAVR